MNIEHLKIKASQNYETAEWAEGKRYFDVCISRYYYCLYQKIIYLSRNKGFYKEPIKTESSHNDTITNFIERMSDKLTDEEKIDMGGLKNLRKIRNTAEYNDVMFDKNTFNLAFKFSFNNINEILGRFL